MAPRRSLITLVERELARKVLFRERPEPLWQLQSTEVLAEKFGCSVGTVREAMQRLVALGLVTFTQASGPIMNPLFSAQSSDSLVLEAMAMSNAEERQIAIGHYLELAESIAVEGVVHIVGRHSERIPGMDEELAPLIASLERQEDPVVRARRLHLVAWYAGSISAKRHLHWTANALERAYTHLRPWLERAAEDVRNVRAWKCVREAMLARRAEEAGTRMEIALRPYHVRVMQFTPCDDPSSIIPGGNPTLPHGLGG